MMLVLVEILRPSRQILLRFIETETVFDLSNIRSESGLWPLQLMSLQLLVRLELGE